VEGLNLALLKAVVMTSISLASLEQLLDENCRRQWFDVMFGDRATLGRNVRRLLSIFLGAFRTLYRTPPGRPIGQWQLKADVALWHFVTIASVLALICSAAYGILHIGGQLDNILAMVLAGAFVSTIGILACQAAGDGFWKGGGLPILFFLVLILIPAAVFWGLCDCNFPDSLKQGAITRQAVDTASTDVILVKVRWLPHQPLPFSLLGLGILFGSVAGVLTGLSLGRARGVFVGVGAGLIGGFMAGIVGHHAYVGWQSSKAHEIFQTMGAISLLLPIFAYFMSQVLRQEEGQQQWHSRALRFLQSFRAIRILGTSLVVIVLLSVFFAWSRLVTLHEVVQAVLGPQWVDLALNILADAFSMIETYYILVLAAVALAYFRGVKLLLVLVGIVLLDLAASSITFLAIPLCSRSWDVFPAIVFQPPRPWIGILFWASLSTSAIFYLFLLSSIAVTAVEPVRLFLAKCVKPHLSPTRPGLAVAAMLSIVVSVIIGVNMLVQELIALWRA
jgi:hypothetical protein